MFAEKKELLAEKINKEEKRRNRNMMNVKRAGYKKKTPRQARGDNWNLLLRRE